MYNERQEVFAMVGKLHRTQILLEPEQHKELARIAEHEGRSVSDVVREIIRGELEKRSLSEEETLKRRLAALERIQQHKEEILRRRGGRYIELDPVEVIRQ